MKNRVRYFLFSAVAVLLPFSLAQANREISPSISRAFEMTSEIKETDPVDLIIADFKNGAFQELLAANELSYQKVYFNRISEYIFPFFFMKHIYDYLFSVTELNEIRNDVLFQHLEEVSDPEIKLNLAKLQQNTLSLEEHMVEGYFMELTFSNTEYEQKRDDLDAEGLEIEDSLRLIAQEFLIRSSLVDDIKDNKKNAYQLKVALDLLQFQRMEEVALHSSAKNTLLPFLEVAQSAWLKRQKNLATEHWLAELPQKTALSLAEQEILAYIAPFQEEYAKLNQKLHSDPEDKDFESETSSMDTP